MRGYFAVGIECPKTEPNVGTLFRSASVFGAAFVFTVGARYSRPATDTVAAGRHMPLFHFDSLDALEANLPWSCPVVGVEMDDRAVMIGSFAHPERACYLLGAEDRGLSEEAVERAHALVRLPGEHSLNVSVAGSIVLFDRVASGKPLARPQPLLARRAS